MNTEIFHSPYGATPLNPEEKEGLKFKNVSTKAQLDQLEQANIDDGLLWLKKHRTKVILTDVFIKNFHKKLFGQVWSWAGCYRKTDKNIGVDWLQIPIELKKLLDDVQYWTENKSYKPMECAIRFHHRLVAIHLFSNGNGRHARFMADEYLRHHFQLGPIRWLSNPENDNQSRKQYIEALRAADRGDYNPLLSLIGESTPK